ncbi:MAG: nucleotide pyrophosphohydrolase [Eubacteriales bacterium]|nr:nucleotide pyrophosphohydrolase [Eubacteriales bacterium]
MADIKEELRAFNKERDWDQFHSPENLAKSIAIESGELLECFQWDGKNYSLEDVKGELADVLTYCYMLADKLNLDPIAIMEEKLAITKKKYPVEKSKGRSTKYDKL